MLLAPAAYSPLHHWQGVAAAKKEEEDNSYIPCPLGDYHNIPLLLGPTVMLCWRGMSTPEEEDDNDNSLPSLNDIPPSLQDDDDILALLGYPVMSLMPFDT